MANVVDNIGVPPGFDNTFAALPERFFAKQIPTPVRTPGLIAVNEALALELGLDPAWLKSESGVSVLAGNVVPKGAEPLSMAYAGHQFGNWVPQLGDGRAVMLGEVVNSDGERYDVQLKGSGPTPFSRNGDGRAWIGPVMREYLVSEAMHALGIPTTRALAAVTTGETVARERLLPGGVITRVAKSHIRVGTFQYLAARGDVEGLRTLADYAINRLYPNIVDSDNPYLALLQAVSGAQAELIAKWMSVGFIHGVMNTDNMAISGETIDYGPCAFMDEYHPDKVFSSIDELGRYAYSNQPKIGQWNLICFAQCLLPLIDKDEERAISLAQSVVDEFPNHYQQFYDQLFANKIGLRVSGDRSKKLVTDLLQIMSANGADFTTTFNSLADAIQNPDSGSEKFLAQFNTKDNGQRWLEEWRSELDENESGPEIIIDTMKLANPKIIPRNHLIEAVIRSALDTGTFDEFHRLNQVLSSPFSDAVEKSDYSAIPAEAEKVRYTFCGT